MTTLLRRTALIFMTATWAAWLLLSESCIPWFIVLAITIHETGHFIASLLLRTPLKKLSLQNGGFLMLGNSCYDSYFSEGVIALAGPFFNFVSALTILSAQSAPFIMFKQISLSLGLLNLLPIKDFDGGRIAKCILSAALPLDLSEKICDILSFLATYFIWSTAVYITIKTGENVSAFIFSVMMFFKMIPQSRDKRICEIIGE